MLAYLQRRLIYRPKRMKVLSLEECGLSPAMVTPVKVETHDGLLLNGWHYAAGADARWASNSDEIENRESRGLIIYFTGNAKNRGFRVVNCLTLAALGAEVLLVDYRGYGENPGSPREEHFARDARAIRDFAVESLKFPLSKIVFYGESLGGAVATRLAAETCAQGVSAAGVILGSTFTTLADAGAPLYPWLPVRLVLVENYRSIDRIPAIRSPLLMIHGSDDEIVPVEMGRLLFDAAPAQSHCGFAKRFVEIPAGHNNVYRTARNELQAAIAAFLDDIWGRQPVEPRAEVYRELRLESTPY